MEERVLFEWEESNEVGDRCTDLEFKYRSPIWMVSFFLLKVHLPQLPTEKKN